MNLIPTRVVDKNGRATTVHKRSGSAIAAPTKLSAVKPSLRGGKKKPASKIDAPFTYNVHAAFSGTRLGNYLNKKYPDRSLEKPDMSDTPVEVNTRDVYRIARHGLQVRSAIHLAHYGVTEDEALNLAENLKRAGYGDDLPLERPNPWMDVMLEADIDHNTLLSAYENGLSKYDLDEMPPSNAADAIRAYSYKGFSKTRLAERVRSGAYSWADIQSIGVTRATKNEWIITETLSRFNYLEGSHEVTLPVIGDMLRDIEEKPRTTLESGREEALNNKLYGLSDVYRVVGEETFSMHMPEIALALRHTGLKGNDLAEAALYCDEVVHKVRSNQNLSDAVIAANNGHRYRSKRGTYKGQYEDGDDPVWHFPVLLEYKNAGLSADQCVDALVSGMSPERAAEAIQTGIASSMTEGWL